MTSQQGSVQPPKDYNSNYLALMINAVNDSVEAGQNQQLIDGQTTMLAVQNEDTIYNSWKMPMSQLTSNALGGFASHMKNAGSNGLTLSQIAYAAQKVIGNYKYSSTGGWKVNAWSSKNLALEAQKAQALNQQAQLEQQQATNVADSGVQSMQTQLSQDSTNNQQKVTLVNSINTLMQASANMTLS